MMAYKFVLALGALTASCFSTARAFDAYGDDDDDGTNATAQTIIGGEIIEEGSRPYLVSIGAGESGTGQSCGGSLITPHAVMTAAHCLFKKLDEPVNGKNYTWDPPEWVEFHRYDLCDDSGVVRLYLESDESQTSGDMFYHIDYDWDTDVNDVAILFLPTPINDIKPVTLNTDPQVPANDDPLDVAGWGLTDEGDGQMPRSFPRYPKAVTINYLTNEACTSEPYKWSASRITDQMMCATADDKDSCGGDSGVCCLLNIFLSVPFQ
jgi:secreted trypsin-like serine protease